MSIQIDTRSPSYLGEYTIGDRYPFPYFILTERKFNPTTLQFEESQIDNADYSSIKFCARSITNTSSADDHSKDNIYSALTHDTGGVYHYEWGANDLKVGSYFVRIEMTRNDGKVVHSSFYFYTVINKMQTFQI